MKVLVPQKTNLKILKRERIYTKFREIPIASHNIRYIKFRILLKVNGMIQELWQAQELWYKKQE